MSKVTEQFIYIVQASLETAKCKIGKTDNPDRRLKEYNSITGKSKDNHYAYLFVAQVSDMAQAEKAIKEKFSHLREEKSREIYFYNSFLFKDYVEFITYHELFVTEVYIRPKELKSVIKIMKKTTPSLIERGSTRKNVLQKDQKIGGDEFYTRYEDIKKEIPQYSKDVWKNKVVFCNCDDAVGVNDVMTSDFPLYFTRNFKALGLKELICTHYSGDVDSFNQGSVGYIFRKNRYREIKYTPKNYNGSFDHPLSVKILIEEADIVCTYPPFSREIDYWKLLIRSGKKFLIISAVTNPINTYFIPYFMNEQAWAGYNEVAEFLNSKRETTRAQNYWFTNLVIGNRQKNKQLKFVPLENIPSKLKKYDDHKMLLVDNCYIPSDYKKPFAVSARPILNGVLESGYEICDDKGYIPVVDKNEKIRRVLIQKT